MLRERRGSRTERKADSHSKTDGESKTVAEPEGMKETTTRPRWERRNLGHPNTRRFPSCSLHHYGAFHPARHVSPLCITTTTSSPPPHHHYYHVTFHNHVFPIIVTNPFHRLTVLISSPHPIPTPSLRTLLHYTLIP